LSLDNGGFPNVGHPEADGRRLGLFRHGGQALCSIESSFLEAVVMKQFRSRLLAGVVLGAVAAASAYTVPAKIESFLDKYRGYSELTTAAGSMSLDTYTYNLTTWQMTHGGFSKAHAALYVAPWDKAAELSSWTGTNGEPLGMYDNNATVQEMRLLATQYKTTTNATYKAAFKASFAKAAGFVVASQLPNGGWPQVYPKRGNYSDMATYNDNAMIRLMVLVKDIVAKKAPFDSDILDAATIAKLQTALDKSVQFALKAQIVNGGNPTVWCAQHDPSTYAPVGARAYELASKSGSESVGVIAFLMAWSDQSAAVQKAVKGALAWYKKTKVLDMKFSSGEFVASAGSSMWYRFYNVANDSQFFCDRDGIKTYDFMSVSLERRTGYQWGGDYGSGILGLESAYLAAIPVSVQPSVHSRPATARVVDGVVALSVERDGAWTARWLSPAGALLASDRAEAREGRLAVPAPASLRSGVAFLFLTGPGASRTVPVLATP